MLRELQTGVGRATAVAALMLTGCASVFTGHELSDEASRAVLADLDADGAEIAAARYRDLAGHIPNFGVVQPDLYRGAQPDLADLRLLRDAGIATVIDFRDSPIEVASEATACRALGMAYYNLPWSGHEEHVDPELTRRFLDIVRHPANRPAFVHCHRGAERTGTMVAVYRIALEGWTAEEAYSEMNRYRFRGLFFSNLKRFVFEYGNNRMPDR